MPVLECRRVSWVPAFEARAWPDTIFPLGTRDNAKGAIVTLSIPWHYRKGGNTRFGLAFLADDQEIGGYGDIEVALEQGNSAEPEIACYGSRPRQAACFMIVRAEI